MVNPIRIIHVVSEMGPTGGGVEVWLLHVLRNIDRERFRLDFLVHTTRPKAFDEEIRSLGSRVLPCIRPLYLWKYPFAFRRLLRQHGPFDVVHSHTLFGGLAMRLARWGGVPVRIAHSHSDVEGFRVDGDRVRGSFVQHTNRWTRTDATLRLACSRRAGNAMFGRPGPGGPDWSVLYYGIDLSPFQKPADRDAIRAELGLAPDALVVGHVGRFQEQKNHAFLIDVAAALVRRDPRVRLLLIGDGPLRPAVDQRIKQANLGGHVLFLGVRDDVPRLMRGAMDVFVLPSRYEGLPLVGIEAQAAGLPCVLSDAITEELDVVPGLVCRLALTRLADEWAVAIEAARDVRRTISPRDALAALTTSPFNIHNAVRQLEVTYEECVARSLSFAGHG